MSAAVVPAASGTMDPPVDGEPAVGEGLRRNVHRSHLVHDRGVEEYDAVVARLDELERVGAAELAVLKLIVVDAQIPARESPGLAIEVVHVGELSRRVDRALALIRVRAKVAAVGARGHLAFDAAHVEARHPELRYDLRHHGAD